MNRTEAYAYMKQSLDPDGSSDAVFHKMFFLPTAADLPDGDWRPVSDEQYDCTDVPECVSTDQPVAVADGRLLVAGYERGSGGPFSGPEIWYFAFDPAPPVHD